MAEPSDGRRLASARASSARAMARLARFLSRATYRNSSAGARIASAGDLVIGWLLQQIFDAMSGGRQAGLGIYGIVAVSLVVLTGWGGQVSLGQWGFAGVGALGFGMSRIV